MGLFYHLVLNVRLGREWFTSKRGGVRMRKALYLLLAIIGLPFATPLVAICYLQDLLRESQ
jgi:hypothetical protein